VAVLPRHFRRDAQDGPVGQDIDHVELNVPLPRISCTWFVNAWMMVSVRKTRPSCIRFFYLIAGPDVVLVQPDKRSVIKPQPTRHRLLF